MERTATRITVSAFGVLAGLAGIEHGVGEIRQGGEQPDGIAFESWPDTGAFAPLDGEPAMSLVPNLLVSGVLAIVVSVVFIVWVVWHIDRPHGGLVLIGLSLALLLGGGGFGPPLLGVILGVAAMRRSSPPRRLRHHVLAAMWPWSLAAALVAWLTLMPGLVLIEATVGLPSPDAVVATVTSSAFALLFLTIATAYARDLEPLPSGRRAVGH